MKKVLSLVCLLAVVASCLFVFASCGGGTPNTDGKKALENLKANNYIIQNETINENGEGRIVAISEDFEDTITVVYCATEEQAQAAYDQLAKTDNGEAEIGKEGKMVWVATSGAISATK